MNKFKPIEEGINFSKDYMSPEDRINKIIILFKAKKEELIKKSYNVKEQRVQLDFDLDKNEKSLRSLIFLSEYFKNQWKEKRKIRRLELKSDNKNNDFVIEQMNKWNSYYNINRKEKISIKADNYNLDDSSRRALVIMERLKDSLSHKNESYYSCAYDMCIYLNNPGGKFEGIIPCKYLENFLNDDGPLEYYKSDKPIVDRTNKIVDSIFKQRKNEIKVGSELKVKEQNDFGEKAYNFQKQLFNKDSFEFLKNNNSKLTTVLLYMERTFPFYKEEYYNFIKEDSPLYKYRNDLIRLRNVSSHLTFNEVPGDPNKIELYDKTNEGITWGPKVFDLDELYKILFDVRTFIVNITNEDNRSFSL